MPVAQFVSRLYIFHYDPLEVWDVNAVPPEEVDRVIQQGKASWAAKGTKAP